MMLLEPLPGTLQVDGRAVPIRPDYREWMRFELLMQEPDVPYAWRSEAAIKLIYREPVTDIPAALEQILWFYACGQPKRKRQRKGAQAAIPKRIYDLEIDAPLVYAAFLSQYGIDLCDTKLHWWKFRALFDGLSEDQQLCKVMGYRAVDISKIKSKEEKQRLQKLQALYRLPSAMSTEDKIAAAGSIFAM